MPFWFGNFVFLYLITGLPVFVILLVFVHLKFPKTITNDLFKEPYFNQQELLIFSTFPYSLLKTLAFLRGTVAPGTIRNRFKDYDFTGNMSVGFYWLCVVLVALIIVTGTLSFIVAGFGIKTVWFK